ncbi:MAG: FadD3 family acyl-CoA ligase [Rhodospirillaceae bacterium]|nr:FadD3 family acyl-CoA ligase [Rhodospirillaceae bacterium]
MIHVPQRISTLPTTVPDALRIAARRTPDAVAVESEDGARLTFAEAQRAVLAAAKAFLAYGLKRGDRISVWAPNMPAWIIVTLAAQTVGGVLVPINTRLKGREAAYIINRSRARLLFTVTNFLNTDYPALLKSESLPDLEKIILLQGRDWSDFIAAGANISDADVERAAAALTGDDVADIMFTSGTTGKPKGAIATHGQIVQTYQSWVDFVGLRADDRYLIVNPFFHTYGYKAGWVACLIAGAAILPHAVFDADTIIDRIAKDRVTVMPGPPTLFQSILASKKRPGADLSSLRMCTTGAASVPHQLIEDMKNILGFDVVVTAYGLTETNGTVSMCSVDDSIERVATTAGRAIPGIEVRCVDTAGKDVPPGTPGEILVRGFNVMKGYLDDPKATAEAIDADGWLKTGDIGIIDAEGYIRITDRAKDLFIVGGFNCYPAEIEELLLDHPAIAQVAVIGVPDERMGEVGKAFVKLHDGQKLTAEELIAWSRKSMANYKVPRFVEFVDTFPTTASGKIQRFELRK